MTIHNYLQATCIYIFLIRSKNITKRCGIFINTGLSYAVNTRFESRPEDHISYFRGFPHSLQESAGILP